MSRSNGVWVSKTEFVQFASPRDQLSDHIATRDRSPDFSALGMYLPNPDPVLKRMGKDVSTYRDLRSDAHVGGCVRRRKAAVKSLEWSIEQSDAPARLVKKIEAIFKKLDMNRILGEMVEAALYGYQPMEIMWGKADGWWVPVDVIGKPQEWFVFGPEADLRFRSREAMLMGEALPGRKFLLPRQEPSYQNPYGLADMAMCFWPATFKRGGLKFWVTFTEKYGTPWLVGKTPRGTPNTERDNLLSQLESMVQDAVAVIPDDSSVDIVEGQKTSSSTIYADLLMYCRSEISIALLGQNQTTEANSNKASATAGLEVTNDIRDADAGMVEAAMNELIRWIVEVNTGTDVAPTFSMWEQEEVNETLAKRDEILSRSGVIFTKSYFTRTYELRDDDIEVGVPTPTTGLNPNSDSTPADVGTDKKIGDEAKKYDASMMNAYSMGIERFANLGVDVPVDFVRNIFNIPEPKQGQAVLARTANVSTDTAPAFSEGSVAASPPGQNSLDGIDQAIENEMADWQPVMDGLIDPIQAAFDKALKDGLTAEQLIEQLPELLRNMKPEELQQRLAQSAFAARLVAALGVNVGADSSAQGE